MRQCTIAIIGGLILLFLLAYLIALIHHPLLIQEFDYLMVHTHHLFCSTNAVPSFNHEVPSFRDIFTWKILSIIFLWKGSNICQVSNVFRDFRCTLRLDRIDLDSVQHWNNIMLQNVTISTDHECEFGKHIETNRPSISEFLTLQMFRNVDKRVSIYLSPIISTNDLQSLAFDIKTLYLNWHSFIRPKIDVTISKIQIFASIGTENVHISHNIQIPSPILRVGNWTIQDILEFIPPPPKERGQFPRLGVVNITDMTIILQDMLTENCHDCQDKSFRLELPNELFHPLLTETLDTRKDGIDPMDIEPLLKKVLLITSKNQFIHTIASSDLIQSMRDLAARLNRVMGGNLPRLENNYIAKLLLHESSNFEDFSNELKHNWEDVKRSFIHLEDGLREFVTSFEQKAERAWNEVKPKFEDIMHST